MVGKPREQEAGTHVSTTSLRQREQMKVVKVFTLKAGQPPGHASSDKMSPNSTINRNQVLKCLRLRGIILI